METLEKCGKLVKIEQILATFTWNIYKCSKNQLTLALLLANLNSL